VKLNEDIGTEVGWAALNALEHDELESMEVNVTGYPLSKSPLSIAFRIPSYNKYTMNGRITKVSKHKLYHDIDTSGGQSGSCVWRINKDGEIEVVGVHTTGGSKIEGNGAVRINDENIGIIYDWLLKLGEIDDQQKS
jgi:V8-like Glu-specific endopeptidase